MTDCFRPALPPGHLGQLSSLALAYVGDGVYELLWRTSMVSRSSVGAAGLHRRTVAKVRAGAQADAARLILSALTQEEHDVFRRGRNAKMHATPKGASGEEYALATGLEALFGWLYLSGQAARLDALFSQIEAGADKEVPPCQN